MDRQQFIMQTGTKEGDSSNSCGLEECICEANILPAEFTFKKKNLLHLAAITVLAFLCAYGVSVLKNDGAGAAILQQKISSLACGPGNTGSKKDIQHNQPFNKSGNSCPHQSSITCMACCSDQRRRSWLIDEDMS